jgi:glucokinase
MNRLNMDRLAISADIGGTNLRVALINETGRILHREEVPTPEGANGSTVLLDSLTELHRKCAREASGEVVGFAIALPAVLDIGVGVVVESPNLPFINGLGVFRELRKQIPTPIILENDATAAAIGEAWLGASAGSQSSVCLTLGTGVGGGLIIDGKPLRGIDGTAGELGHVCLEPNGHPCGCGGRGCLEQYASATAVVRMAAERASELSGSFRGPGMHRSAKDVFDLGREGDAAAIAAFDSVGFYLGLAISGFINMLNPEVVVIGGGASGAWDLFAPKMLKTISRQAFNRPAKRAKIVRALLGGDAGLIGAASLVFDARNHNPIDQTV